MQKNPKKKKINQKNPFRMTKINQKTFYPNFFFYLIQKKNKRYTKTNQTNDENLKI
jgi:hypothetical protein